MNINTHIYRKQYFVFKGRGSNFKSFTIFLVIIAWNENLYDTWEILYN